MKEIKNLKNNDPNYIPVIPAYVAPWIDAQKTGRYHCGGQRKFDRWARHYSRKYKYALLNGYTIYEKVVKKLDWSEDEL